MVIRREDVDAGLVDFSDLATGERLAPLHPGELLRDEFMGPLGLSAKALARALHVPTNRITAILRGERAVTADTAMRLARYLGTSVDLWLGLQMAYERDVAQGELAQRIEREVQPRAA